jgi:hypothetical protein
MRDGIISQITLFQVNDFHRHEILGTSKQAYTLEEPNSIFIV